MSEPFDSDVRTVLGEMEYMGDIEDAGAEFENFEKSGSSADDWFFDNFPDTWSTLG